MNPTQSDPRRPGAPTRTAGFTLVEVMVVMLIMSGLLVAITQVLNAARSTRDVIHNVQETQLAGPAVLDLVERDLRAMFLYGREPAEALFVKDRTISGLDADSLALVSSTDSMLRTERDATDYVFADYGEVGYVLRPNPDAPSDFLEIWRREGFGIDEEPFQGGQYSFLHDRVKGFDIQCFREIGEDAEPIDGWGEGEDVGLPRRIEITLILELAPRLVREQMEVARVDKRTVTYRRVFPVPSPLLTAVSVQPVALIPDITPAIQGLAPGQTPGAAGLGGGLQDGGGLIDGGTTDGLPPGGLPFGANPDSNAPVPDLGGLLGG